MQAAEAQLKVDVLVVGAGPAGLACAIRLARAGKGQRQIMVLEKSAQLGGHLLSGAVMRPQALQHLLMPDEYAALPIGPLVTRDTFHALLPKGAIRVPFVPPKMRMRGLPLVSLAQLGSALGDIATKLGVEILTSQTADALLWEGDRVSGVRTLDDPILADTTVLAEGPAGLLTKAVLARHPQLAGPNLQTYALGIKEIVEVPANPALVGTVAHTFGYPLGINIYGGGFIYHMDETHVALGLAIALDYHDPATYPHDLFRRWKRHPFVQRHIAGGKTVEYGARLVPEGGWHSRLGMAAPGAFIIGDSAGLVDTMELKGIHLAVESGMAAADAIIRGDALRQEDMPSLDGLRRTANYRAAFRAGLPIGMAAAGLAWISGGRLPWGRIRQRDERQCLHEIGHRQPPLPQPDNGPLDLGLDSDLFLARLRYRPDTDHIAIPDADKCRECFQRFAAPCTRFCPAGVYEADATRTAIHIRAENCVQCRCCTLKCPYDNIRWETPEHGVGPDYQNV